jgi:hypothetical protein
VHPAFHIRANLTALRGVERLITQPCQELPRRCIPRSPPHAAQTRATRCIPVQHWLVWLAGQLPGPQGMVGLE